MVQTIHDIIKAHGGVPIAPDSYREGIKMEMKEDEGSEFIIQLSLNQGL